MIETSDSAKGFWAICASCGIVLSPHNQIIDRQRKGEPVAQGYLCGRYGKEYYLCGSCLTKAKPLPYVEKRPKGYQKLSGGIQKAIDRMNTKFLNPTKEPSSQQDQKMKS